MKNDGIPKLAAPGAGLPWIELMVARLIFRRFRRRTNREEVARLFASEREELLRLAGVCGPEKATQQILIRRLPGMEDSSRNWSVCMTLEHLRIVNKAVSGSIRSLAAGTVPAGSASTAAVKPAAGIGTEVLAGFSESCDELIGTVAGISNLRTAAKYGHPWFGALDAAGWHAMAAFHMRLHRKQVESIIRSSLG